MNHQLYAVDKGQGEVLVLLHGNGESSDYFTRQIDFFSAFYRVLAVDTRGHGRSPRGTGPFTLERFADDLFTFLTEHGVTRAHILGFSDGGNIALLFALKYPEHVGCLILNGANLNPFGLKLSVLLPIWLGWCSAALRALFSEDAIRQKELLNLMAAEPNIRPVSLRRIAAPSLVIVGNRDMIRRRHTKKIAQYLPNSRLVILNGTHFIASKQSKAFNDAVYALLEENTSRE